MTTIMDILYEVGVLMLKIFGLSLFASSVYSISINKISFGLVLFFISFIIIDLTPSWIKIFYKRLKYTDELVEKCINSGEDEK